MPFDGFINLAYTWQDDIHFGLTRNPLQEQDSYGIANLNIGINEKSTDRYRVTFFVNNLADKSYRNAVADIRQLFGGRTALVQNLPRDSERYLGVR